MTNSINEILKTDVMLLIGANTTEAHPVTGYRIKQAVRNGKKLIVADPRKIELVRYADLWLRNRPGTDIALLNGLAHVILRDNIWDQDFVANRSEGFEEWRNTVESYTPQRVEQITGVKADLIEQAAHMYGEAEKATIIYAMGITQHTKGVHNVFSLANLAILTGNVGREGTGVDPLRGQNNVQGSCDMGCLPNFLPSYNFVDSDEARNKFGEYWNTDIPSEVGITVTEMMEGANTGSIEAMYIMGENPVLSDPDANHVVEALKNLDFLVVQDIFLTETAELAEVVLPAVTFAEKEGTFTNTERRIQRVRQAVKIESRAKPDWEILVELANKMGCSWSYPKGPEEIMKEIAGVTPLYGGISYERLEEGGLQWPCPSKDHPGTPYLHANNFTRGKGKFHSVEHLPAAEVPDEEYPLILSTGRMLYHFHTGTMSRRGRIEKIRPEELMMLHPEDAGKLGIADLDIVQVESRRGKIKTKVQVTDHVPPGMVFMTFHYKESPANVLTNNATDPICKIPELKMAAVRVTKNE